MALTLQVLGRFRLFGPNGDEINLPSRKDQALLAVIALSENKSLRRDRLSDLLWGNKPEKTARHSLSQSLSVIRRCAGTESRRLIAADRMRVGLNPDQINVDAWEFSRLAGSDDPAALLSAAKMYSGYVVDGINLDDEPIETWLSIAREKHRLSACEVLSRLCDASEKQGRMDMGLWAAKRLIHVAPEREEGHLRLMRLLAELGSNDEALSAYRSGAEALRRELDADPGPEMETLRKAVLDKQRETRVSLIVSRRPSIAVHPFTTRLGDQGLRCLAGDVSEGLVVDLARSKSATVILGGAASTDYRLSGQISRASARINVTIVFRHGRSGQVVWADRLEFCSEKGPPTGEAISASITGRLEPVLIQDRGVRQPVDPDDLSAEELVSRGFTHMNRLTPGGKCAALSMFKKAIAVDPDYARAYACAAWCSRRDAQMRGNVLSMQAKAETVRLIDKALSVDSSDPFVLWHAGAVKTHVERNFPAALDLITRSLALNPNSTRAWSASAEIHALTGATKNAAEHARRSIEFAPADPSMWVPFGALANAYLQEGKLDQAESWAVRSLARNSENHVANLIYASAIARRQRCDEARQQLAPLLDAYPALTAATIKHQFPTGHYCDYAGFVDGLVAAALPKS